MQEVFIWGRIVFFGIIIFGPNLLAIFLIGRDKYKFEQLDGVKFVEPHKAVLLMASPIVFLILLLIWALFANGDVRFFHIIVLFGLVFLAICIAREVGTRWRINWTDEYVDGPCSFSLFSKVERISVHWCDIVSIREENRKVFIKTADGRKIIFTRKYRGFLYVLRAIHLKCPDIEYSKAPHEWLSVQGSIKN